MILYNDPAVQSAIIQTIGTIFAAIFAAICAAIIGKRIADRDKLKEKLNTALDDIAFLLAVEDEHCKLHKESIGDTYKLKIRQLANDRGLNWSAKFTPGRAKASR